MRGSSSLILKIFPHCWGWHCIWCLCVHWKVLSVTSREVSVFGIRVFLREQVYELGIGIGAFLVFILHPLMFLVQNCAHFRLL